LGLILLQLTASQDAVFSLRFGSVALACAIKSDAVAKTGLTDELNGVAYGSLDCIYAGWCYDGTMHNPISNDTLLFVHFWWLTVIT
jgi:hypothetical protein